MAYLQPCPNERATVAQLLGTARATVVQGLADAKAIARATVKQATQARLNAMASGELPTLP